MSENTTSNERKKTKSASEATCDVVDQLPMAEIANILFEAPANQIFHTTGKPRRMNNKTFQPVLIVAGPTASGKSALALDLAEAFDGGGDQCRQHAGL